jgi:hypothetical protein
MSDRHGIFLPTRRKRQIIPRPGSRARAPSQFFKLLSRRREAVVGCLLVRNRPIDFSRSRKIKRLLVVVNAGKAAVVESKCSPRRGSLPLCAPTIGPCIGATATKRCLLPLRATAHCNRRRPSANQWWKRGPPSPIMRIIEAWPSAQALGFWKMRILLGGAEVEVRPSTRGPPSSDRHDVRGALLGIICLVHLARDHAYAEPDSAPDYCGVACSAT